MDTNFVGVISEGPSLIWQGTLDGEQRAAQGLFSESVTRVTAPGGAWVGMRNYPDDRYEYSITPGAAVLWESPDMGGKVGPAPPPFLSEFSFLGMVYHDQYNIQYYW